MTSSLDCTIRTWDLPTSHLIDVFHVPRIPTSLTFSPTGDFLATSHVGEVGIFLWANKSQYVNLSLRPLSQDEEETVTVCLPHSGNSGDESLLESYEKIEDIEKKDSLVLAGEHSVLSPEQITEEMITLSSLPRSKWTILLNLDTIKVN